MGSCLSKKHPCAKQSTICNTNNNNNIPKTQQNELKIATQKVHDSVVNAQANVVVEEKKVDKKEVFVIQHRKSSDVDLSGSGSGSGVSDQESVGRNLMAAAASGQVVRTSSCTKEEVDAILIQCGRLSRSNSGHGRRYSGSKRSFDFDREGDEGTGDGDGRRESRGSNRRSPRSSRERVEERSGSRERTSGRRVSRSPVRRSDSPMSGNVNNGNNGKPGKLVSVPPTVTSLSNENGNGSVKRVLVKRNVGSPRSQSPARGIQVNGTSSGNGNGNGRSQSPALGCNGRCQSPAKGNGNGNGNGRSQSPIRASGNGNGNGNGGPVSRNGSRKAEQSPYRRTPLNEIDLNSLPFQPLANKRVPNKGKEIIEEDNSLVVKHPVNSVSQNKYATPGTHRRSRSRGAEGYEITKTNYCRVNDFHTPNLEQMTKDLEKDQLNAIEYDAMVTPVVLSGNDTLKLPQTLVRSRSARRSRDFDINVDALSTPTPTPTNYTSLLLQDIQNFHQNKNPNPNANSNTNSNTTFDNITPNNSASPNFTLPPCLSKACSILEAVADLNSTTGPNSSFTFTDDKRVNPSKKRFDPFVESEIKVGDDLMEPSLHKYVTVRKKGCDMDGEESSGSNSIVGSGVQQTWVSSSSWEPNSAESTDCWTSKTYSREDISPVGFQRNAISDLACGSVESRSRTGPVTASM